MNLSSLRLMQLCSANLPTGAYAFSHGLETATEEGWINNFEQTRDWLDLQIDYALSRTDLPVLQRIMTALQKSDITRVKYWNQLILALRETNELRLSDCATGQALIRVLKSQDQVDTKSLEQQMTDTSFVTAFTYAAYQWNINCEEACFGYAWSWLENLVAAATKLVPLGQTQSQQLLEKLQPSLLNAIKHAGHVAEDNIGESLPMLAIASCWHERNKAVFPDPTGPPTPTRRAGRI